MSNYLRQLILKYADKYIRNIEANLKLSLWGGDVVLNNLDLRLDVLQQDLGVPPCFRFSSGSLKELRIHIPWTALTTKSIEVTLSDVECTLIFDPTASSGVSLAKAQGETAPGPQGLPLKDTRTLKTSPEENTPKNQGGWTNELLQKIISNLTVRINSLVLIYQHGATLVKLKLGSLVVRSASSGWNPRFSELSGPFKLLRKTCEIRKLSIETEVLAGSTELDNEYVPEKRVLLREVDCDARVKTFVASFTSGARVFDPLELANSSLNSEPAVAIDINFVRPVHIALTNGQVSTFLRYHSSVAEWRQKMRASKVIIKTSEPETDSQLNTSAVQETAASQDLGRNQKKKTGWLSWMLGQELEKDEEESNHFHPSSELVICLHVPFFSIFFAQPCEEKGEEKSLDYFASMQITQLASCLALPVLTEISPVPAKLAEKNFIDRASLSIGTLSLVDHTKVEPLPCFMLGDDEWVNSTFKFVEVIERVQPARWDPFGEQNICLLYSKGTPVGTPQLSPFTPGATRLTPVMKPLNGKGIRRSSRSFSTPTTPKSALLSGPSPFALPPPSLAPDPDSPHHLDSGSPALCPEPHGQVGLSLFHTSSSTQCSSRTDLLLGVASIMLDLKSGGGGIRFFDSAFAFVSSIRPKSADKPSKDYSAVKNNQTSLVQRLHSFRLFVPHFVAVVRVADANRWRKDSFFDKTSNSICIDIVSFAFKSAWQDEDGPPQEPRETVKSDLTDGIYLERFQVLSSWIEVKKSGWSPRYQSLSESRGTPNNLNQCHKDVLIDVSGVCIDVRVNTGESSPIAPASSLGKIPPIKVFHNLLGSLFPGPAHSPSEHTFLHPEISAEMSFASFFLKFSLPKMYLFVLAASALASLTDFGHGEVHSSPQPRVLSKTQQSILTLRPNSFFLNSALAESTLVLTINEVLLFLCVEHPKVDDGPPCLAATFSLASLVFQVRRHFETRNIVVGPSLMYTATDKSGSNSANLIRVSLTIPLAVVQAILAIFAFTRFRNLHAPYARQELDATLRHPGRLLVSAKSVTCVWDNVIADIFGWFPQWLRRGSLSDTKKVVSPGAGISGKLTMSEAAQLSVTLLLNTLTINFSFMSWTICFPFDSFHMPSERSSNFLADISKPKGFKPIYILTPAINASNVQLSNNNSPQNLKCKFPLVSGKCINLKISLEHAHAFVGESHFPQAISRKQLESSDPKTSWLKFLQCLQEDFTRSGRCDIFRPCSINLGVDIVERRSPKNGLYKTCHISCILKFESVDVSFTAQQVAAVAEILACLQVAPQAECAYRSSEPAVSLPCRKSSATLFETANNLSASVSVLPSGCFVPISVHAKCVLRRSGARLYPDCDSSERMLLSDLIKLESNGVTFEVSFGSLLELWSAEVVVAPIRIALLPWKTRRLEHPAHNLCTFNGLRAGINVLRSSENKLWTVHIHAQIYSTQLVFNTRILNRIHDKMLKKILSSSTKSVLSPPSTGKPSDPTPVRSKTLQLWICCHLDRFQCLIPCVTKTRISSALKCVGVDIQRVWFHSKPGIPIQGLSQLEELIKKASSNQECHFCDALRLRATPPEASSLDQGHCSYNVTRFELEGGVVGVSAFCGEWTPSALRDQPSRFNLQRNPLVLPIELSVAVQFDLPWGAPLSKTKLIHEGVSTHSAFDSHISASPIRLKVTHESLMVLVAVANKLFLESGPADGIKPLQKKCTEVSHSSSSLQWSAKLVFPEVSLSLFGSGAVSETSEHVSSATIRAEHISLFLRSNVSEGATGPRPNIGELTLSSLSLQYFERRHCSDEVDKIEGESLFIHAQDGKEKGQPLLVSKWSAAAANASVKSVSLTIPVSFLAFIFKAVSPVLLLASGGKAPPIPSKPSKRLVSVKFGKIVLSLSNESCGNSGPLVPSRGSMVIQQSVLSFSGSVSERAFLSSIRIDASGVSCSVKHANLNYSMDSNQGIEFLHLMAFNIELQSLFRLSTFGNAQDYLSGEGTPESKSEKCLHVQAKESIMLSLSPPLVHALTSIASSVSGAIGASSTPLKGSAKEAHACAGEKKINSVSSTRNDLSLMKVVDVTGINDLHPLQIQFSSAHETKRWMSWSYDCRRTLHTISISSHLQVGDVPPQEEPASLPSLLCHLSAWDSIQQEFAVVFKFKHPLCSSRQYTLLQRGNFAASSEKWKIEWFPQDPVDSDSTAEGMTSFDLGQLISVNSTFYPHLSRAFKVQVNLHGLEVAFYQNLNKSSNRFSLSNSQSGKSRQHQTFALISNSICITSLQWSLKQSPMPAWKTGILDCRVGAIQLKHLRHATLTNCNIVKPFPLRVLVKTISEIQHDQSNTGHVLPAETLPVSEPSDADLLAVDVSLGKCEVFLGIPSLTSAESLIQQFISFGDSKSKGGSLHSPKVIDDRSRRSADTPQNGSVRSYVNHSYLLENRTGIPLRQPFLTTSISHVIHHTILIRYGQMGTIESKKLPHGHKCAYTWHTIDPGLAFSKNVPPTTDPPFFITAHSATSETQPKKSAEAVPARRYFWMRIAPDVFNAGWSNAFSIDYRNETIANTHEISGAVTVSLLGVADTQASGATKPGTSQKSQRQDILHTASLHFTCKFFPDYTSVTFSPPYTLANELPFSLRVHLTTMDPSEAPPAQRILSSSRELCTPPLLKNLDATEPREYFPEAAAEGFMGFGIESLCCSLPSRTSLPVVVWCEDSPRKQPVVKTSQQHTLFKIHACVGHDCSQYLRLNSFVFDRRQGSACTHESKHDSDAFTTDDTYLKGFVPLGLRRNVSGKLPESKSSLQLSEGVGLLPDIVEFWNWTEVASFSSSWESEVETELNSLCAISHKLDPSQKVFFSCSVQSLETSSKLQGRQPPLSLVLEPAVSLQNSLPEPVVVVACASGGGAAASGGHTFQEELFNSPNLSNSRSEIQEDESSPLSLNIKAIGSGKTKGKVAFMSVGNMMQSGALINSEAEGSVFCLDPRTPFRIFFALNAGSLLGGQHTSTSLPLLAGGAWFSLDSQTIDLKSLGSHPKPKQILMNISNSHSSQAPKYPLRLKVSSTVRFVNYCTHPLFVRTRNSFCVVFPSHYPRTKASERSEDYWTPEDYRHFWVGVSDRSGAAQDANASYLHWSLPLEYDQERHENHEQQQGDRGDVTASTCSYSKVCSIQAKGKAGSSALFRFECSIQPGQAGRVVVTFSPIVILHNRTKWPLRILPSGTRHPPSEIFSLHTYTESIILKPGMEYPLTCWYTSPKSSTREPSPPLTMPDVSSSSYGFQPSLQAGILSDREVLQFTSEDASQADTHVAGSLHEWSWSDPVSLDTTLTERKREKQKNSKQNVQRSGLLRMRRFKQVSSSIVCECERMCRFTVSYPSVPPEQRHSFTHVIFDTPPPPIVIMNSTSLPLVIRSVPKILAMKLQRSGQDSESIEFEEKMFYGSAEDKQSFHVIQSQFTEFYDPAVLRRSVERLPKNDKTTRSKGIESLHERVLNVCH